MARTPPIPAGQPPDATRTAAGQVVTLAGASTLSLRGQGTKWGLRGEVMGKQGMVASGHPLASLAGLKVLAKGFVKRLT